jgi:hypothetical protein
MKKILFLLSIFTIALTLGSCDNPAGNNAPPPPPFVGMWQPIALTGDLLEGRLELTTTGIRRFRDDGSVFWESADLSWNNNIINFTPTFNYYNPLNIGNPVSHTWRIEGGRLYFMNWQYVRVN